MNVESKSIICQYAFYFEKTWVFLTQTFYFVLSKSCQPAFLLWIVIYRPQSKTSWCCTLYYVEDGQGKGRQGERGEGMKKGNKGKRKGEGERREVENEGGREKREGLGNG